MVFCWPVFQQQQSTFLVGIIPPTPRSQIWTNNSVVERCEEDQMYTRYTVIYTKNISTVYCVNVHTCTSQPLFLPIIYHHLPPLWSLMNPFLKLNSRFFSVLVLAHLRHQLRASLAGWHQHPERRRCRKLTMPCLGRGCGILWVSPAEMDDNHS